MIIIKSIEKCGFTLIETLIASFVLIIIATSFFTLFNEVARTCKKSQQFMKAMGIAQSYMEEIKSVPFANVQPVLFENNNGQIEVFPISSDLYEIHLLYKWDFKSKPIEIWSVKSNY